jgi:hypothetical protein
VGSFYENFRIYSGERYSVFFHAEAEEFSSVREYFEGCDEATQAGLLKLVKRISDSGVIYDDTRFRIEDRKHKIYCFKPLQERFFCFFFIGRKIIITSGYKKQGQKLNRRELAKAIHIRERYY